MFKEEITQYCPMCEEWAEKYDQLKAENEEFKKEQIEIKKYLGISHKTILERLEELTEFRDRDRDEIWQLRTTLAEIRVIVENGKRFAESYMVTGEQKTNVLTYANAILQKISEVEDEKKS